MMKDRKERTCAVDEEARRKQSLFQTKNQLLTSINQISEDINNQIIEAKRK